MIYLVGVTALWAFSFSLIGVYLAGSVDSWFAVFTRTALATLVFLPMLKVRAVAVSSACKLMLIGAVQLGLMYCFYYQSFLYLSVPEVLLFTVMTPVYATLFNDVTSQRFHPRFFLWSAVAVLGAIAIRYNQLSSDFLLGLLMVQMANVCFAAGQVSYKKLMAKLPQQLNQTEIFGWFYIGALLISTLGFITFGNSQKLPADNAQWGILIYLGVIASGAGYYYWNKGATQVDVGTLAIMNNLLVPAGITVNIVIWNRDADLVRLTIGGAIILFALFMNQRTKPSESA